MDPECFFSLLGDAQDMSEFPVDVIQMDKIRSEYAEEIKQHGRLVYERST